MRKYSDLEVSAFIHELLATLIVDHPRDGVGKSALFRIARCAGTDERRIGPSSRCPAGEPNSAVALSASISAAECRHHVGTSIRPAGQQRAVLLEQYAVVDRGRRAAADRPVRAAFAMFVPMHVVLSAALNRARSPFAHLTLSRVLSPGPWRHQATGEQAALCRIERPVPYVAEVDRAEQRIGLAHSLQDRHRSRSRTPPLRPIPHHDARLNARLTAVRIAISTSSRSPPRI